MERLGNVLTGWTNSQGNGPVSFRNQVIFTNLVYLIYSRNGGSGVGGVGVTPRCLAKRLQICKKLRKHLVLFLKSNFEFLYVSFDNII